MSNGKLDSTVTGYAGRANGGVRDTGPTQKNEVRVRSTSSLSRVRNI